MTSTPSTNTGMTLPARASDQELAAMTLEPDVPSPFVHFGRSEWDRLAQHTPLPLAQPDIAHLASLGDPIDMQEVETIYRPLAALLQVYVEGRRRTARERRLFLEEPADPPTPFVIGIAGSVAVGKSTIARLLRLLLSRSEKTPRVDLVPTDGFLFPNHVLEEREILERKGFPESYDRFALLDFLARVKAGESNLRVPEYSHVTYDIEPGRFITVNRPDILIVEGVNVLQPPRAFPGSAGVAVSDYFDFSLYVDADVRHIERWYIDRFLQLRATAFTSPDSYFRTYASLTDSQAVATAQAVWRAINLPNLRENILPTRPRATMILTKDDDHRIRNLWLRKD